MHSKVNELSALPTPQKSLQRLLGAARSNQLAFGAGLLILLLAAFSWSATGIISGKVVDRLLEISQTSNHAYAADGTLQMLIALAIGAVLVMWMGNTSGRMLLNQSLLQGLTKIHNDAVKALLRTDMHYFYKNSSGKIISRFSGDYLNATNAFERLFASFVYNVFGVITSIILVLFSKPILVLLIFIFWLFIFATSRYFGKKTHALQTQANLANAAVLNHVSESVNGRAVIVAAGLRPKFELQLEELQSTASKLISQVLQMTSRRTLVQSLLSLVLMGIALSISLRQVQSGSLTIGEVGANLTLLGISLRNFIQVMELLNTLELGFTGVERVGEIADLEPEERRTLISTSVREPTPSQESPLAIELCNLKIRYGENSPWVLKGLNARISVGEKIGIVGKTGCGKSTFFQALLRMIPVSPNEILIHGTDITTYSVSQLRSFFGVVPQEPLLFSGTLLENLFPGQAQPDEEVAIAALKQVHLDEWRKSLSEGLHTHISESGSNLSFGQRQLLCLARALVKKPQIMLFDEATSSVDPSTEHLLDDAMHTALQGTTSLIIAHRLATVERCHRIFVMEEGRIIEAGSLRELMANPRSHFLKLKSAALRNREVIQ
jgi:ABC-type multidrug transport system fused ATPase/permease subunit